MEENVAFKIPYPILVIHWTHQKCCSNLIFAIYDISFAVSMKPGTDQILNFKTIFTVEADK